MMRVFGAALCAALLSISTPAMAQQDWASRTQQMCAPFDTAILQERVMPFVMDMAHPRVLDALGALFGIDGEAAREMSLKGYEHTTKISKILSHRVFCERSILGRASSFDWAIIPYTLTLTIEGDRTPHFLCNRFVMFENNFGTYAVILSDHINDALLRDALPVLAADVLSQEVSCDLP
ncbi:MAG: hypothetical protein WA790_02435 [Sulfitobacter sp.]